MASTQVASIGQASAWLLLTASACAPALAQETITITGRSPGSAAALGFGDVPLARAPAQVAVFGARSLADAGLAQYGGLARLDASVGEAYNAEGYWSSLAVRGYGLDNRYNLRRDGLPINGETAIALGNKERLELIKGTSGIQAGTSSPAGLLNLVVKRPGADRRHALIEARGAGSMLAALDLGQHFGAQHDVAVRVNASTERLDPPLRNTRGERWMLAVAADWRLAPATLLQAEVESSHQRQPSAAGYSLLGHRVPAPSEIDPRRNLNDQPWRQPVVFDGDTASLRWQQQLAPDWRFTLHTMQQRLRTDDRTAFPYGVYDPQTFECAPLCDRFAPDGSFTYWEFISNNERRTSTAAQALLAGRLQLGALAHRVEAGVLRADHRGRFEDQVFDIAGLGRIDGSLVTAPSAGFADANTNRDERSTEWFARDAIEFAWGQAWVGLRHTRLQRSARRTSPDADGSLRATDFEREASTPWLAVSTPLSAKTMLYASWGRGLETEVAPNRPRYLNAGESLALRSRQFEVGLKHGTESVEAALTLFDIDRERAADLGPCDNPGTCIRQLDGAARHRGLEASWTGESAAWSWNLGAMWLHARRHGSAQSGVNGQRPENVPQASLRAGIEARWPGVPGLALTAQLQAEGDRVVLPYDTSVRIPGWSSLDLGARWRMQGQDTTWVWRLALDNATDRRAWKESPYQFGHAYLYPLPPRTWRLSLQVAV